VALLRKEKPLSTFPRALRRVSSYYSSGGDDPELKLGYSININPQ